VEEHVVLSQCEELATRLGITVRYESMKRGDFVNVGGLCRIEDEHFIIINAKAPTRDKIHVLARALKRFDLSSVYVLPALREFIGTIPD